MPRQTRRTFLQTSGALLGGLALGTTVTSATSTERFIVESRNLSTSDLDAAGLEVVHDLDAIGYVVVQGERSSVRSLGAKFAPDTVYSLDLPVEQAPIQQASEAEDEPFYALQWDKQVQNVPDAHEVTRGEGTRVAIIDTGVDAGHPDLAHAVNTDLSADFTGDGYGAGGPYGGYHGTHVAGITAADDENDVGVVGTAPGTEIVDCRVFSYSSLASWGDILAAMVYSVEIGCDAANMSLGAYPVERQGIGEFYGQALNRVVNYANSNGTLIVGAAGNSAADLQHDKNLISLPNEAPNVLSVSATGPIGFGWGEPGLEDPAYSPAFYTNYGTNAIDVGAPGGDADLETDDPNWYLDLVLSTVSDPVFDGDEIVGVSRGWGWAAGTSMAAPQVAGAAALVKSVNPGYNPGQVRQTLERTASVPDEYDKTYYGAGFLDPASAVRD